MFIYQINCQLLRSFICYIYFSFVLYIFIIAGRLIWLNVCCIIAVSVRTV